MMAYDQRTGGSTRGISSYFPRGFNPRGSRQVPSSLVLIKWLCLQDWRSKEDTVSEMIKNVINKMSKWCSACRTSSFYHCNLLQCSFGNWVLGYASTSYPCIVQNKQENCTVFPSKPLLELTKWKIGEGSLWWHVQRTVYLKPWDASHPVWVMGDILRIG